MAITDTRTIQVNPKLLAGLLGMLLVGVGLGMYLSDSGSTVADQVGGAGSGDNGRETVFEAAGAAPDDAATAVDETEAVQDGAEAGAGEADRSASAAFGGEFCPEYTESDHYRPRANQITVTPDQDWEAELANAAPDTEILLADGEYNFTRDGVWMTQADLTIRSASGNRDAVILRGKGYAERGEGLMFAGPRATVADLTITELRNHGISLKPEREGTDANIYNIKTLDIGTQHIKGASGGRNTNGLLACSELGYSPDGVQGDYIAAIDIHEAVDWTIRDNYIFNMTGDGSGCEVDIDCGKYVSHPAILIWNNSSGGVIERNTIVDSWRSITIGLGEPHDGGVIRNNFIYQTNPGDAGIELWNASNMVVEHNTVIANGYPGAIEFGGAPNLVLRNNLLSAPPLDRSSNRGASPDVVTEGNINDASVADLVGPDGPQLAEGSRAIGAGVDTSETNVDIDGDPREDRWDVGADQAE